MGVDLRTPPLTTPRWTETGQEPRELIVACVCWGRKYPDSYVKKLQRAVAKNLDVPHRFVCLSDRQIEGVRCEPLRMSAEHWWNKISLFSRDAFPPGARVLYLDLDVVVVGKLDDLVKQVFNDPIAMIYNFGPNRQHCAHNSSVMMWTAGDPRVANIYDLFTADVSKKLHGDQCWIWRVLRENIANWPKDWVASYKYDARPLGGKLPMGSRVVVFHGDPKPDAVREPWIEEFWK